MKYKTIQKFETESSIALTLQANVSLGFDWTASSYTKSKCWHSPVHGVAIQLGPLWHLQPAVNYAPRYVRVWRELRLADVRCVECAKEKKADTRKKKHDVETSKRERMHVSGGVKCPFQRRRRCTECALGWILYLAPTRQKHRNTSIARASSCILVKINHGKLLFIWSTNDFLLLPAVKDPSQIIC